MKNDIRSSGIGAVGNIPCGTHFSQFYQTKEELIEVIIPYFKAGLENNEFCLWITSDIIGTVEANKILKEFICDIDIYFEKGQMEIIPFSFYSKEGILDSQKALDEIINRANQALTSDYDGLRLTENVCSLEKKKLDDFIFYEEGLNFVIGEYPILALCTYSLEMCTTSDAIEITANHDFSLVKKRGKWGQIKNLGRKKKTKLEQTENALEVEHAKAEEALREIEARQKVVEAVETERQRFFNMLEALPVMICLLTPDYHIAFANRTFREKFGESEGRHCYEYCFGLTKPCEFCEAYKVLETGQLHHWEVTTPDGSVIDAYDLPFTDVDGSPMVLEMDIDITERRKAIETLAKFDEIRIKEIHHRIKNNLQVISSLLDLQAEKFEDETVKKAFGESQDRVVSMALIHEELYKGGKADTLDFSTYLKKLAEKLFQTYSLRGCLKIQISSTFEY